MPQVKVTFLHDVPAAAPAPAYARGQDVMMEAADAVPYAIKQLISVSSLEDPYAPHEVAKLIPANFRPVDSITISPTSVSATVGAADVTVSATVVFKDGGDDLVLADLAAYTSSDTTKATVVKDGTAIKVHAVAAGTATLTVTYGGVTKTAAITVAAA